jgi:BirA family biotin operon repressor/biotin-[acetyl-CoA-carboxylase] ligase
VTVRSEWPKGYGRLHFATIDSTNEEARRLAERGEAGPVWILADIQTAGRGRRGRAWDSPTGNLAATLFLRPGKSAADCAQLSFVAALAVSDAIAELAAGIDVRLKWPNDVLANGRKIAGILLESASAGGEKPSWLAVGIGVNLARFPEQTEFPATSLAALGAKAPSAEDFLTALAAEFAKWYEAWSRRGFAEIRDAWLARAAGLGTRIRARLQNEEIFGVFEGIDDHGALILRTDMARARMIAAGDVFFG